MGKKITIKITGKYDEKAITVRENLTMNNLITIIAREMQLKQENTEISWKGNALAGHQKLRDSGIKEGERIDIGRMEMKVNRAGEQEEEAKDNRWAMTGEGKQYKY